MDSVKKDREPYRVVKLSGNDKSASLMKEAS
jgi:hypothetical protein